MSRLASIPRYGAGTSSDGSPVTALVRGIARLLACGAILAVTGTATPDRALAGSGSSLDRPVRPGPVFLLGTASIGGTPDHDSLRSGYGATLLFRPHAAADFLRFLYRWNVAMVWQADFRPVAEDRRLLAADFILRRYLSDMRGLEGGGSVFLGLGAGGAEITYPSGAGTVASQKWYTYVAEAGYEYGRGSRWVLVAKGQWRRYVHDPFDYSGWSCQVGLGIPLPL